MSLNQYSVTVQNHDLKNLSFILSTYLSVHACQWRLSSAIVLSLSIYRSVLFINLELSNRWLLDASDNRCFGQRHLGDGACILLSSGFDVSIYVPYMGLLIIGNSIKL